MTPAQLSQDLSFIFTELKAPGIYRERVKRKIKKAARQGRLHWDWNNRDWGYRICCAELANARYNWQGWECRSDWAWNLATNDWLYPRWDGDPCRLLVLAEQGLGDEIMYASCLSELALQNGWQHGITVECDPRLFDVYRLSFPHIHFIDRFRDDKGTSKLLDGDYKKDEYDAFIPLGSVPTLYRRKATEFPGKPYLITPAPLVSWITELPKPWIGISWQARQGHIDPREMMNVHPLDSRADNTSQGTYISLQYDADPPDDMRGSIGMAASDLAGKIIVPPIDLRRDITGVFQLVSVLDRVVSVPTTVVHIAGSLGVETHVIRPPDIYPGDVEGKPGLHNRLRYEFGKWQGTMRWYNSVRLYKGLREWQNS